MPTLETIAGQNALFAIIQPEGKTGKQQEQWIYHLDQKRWRPLSLKGVTPQFQTPYGQMSYVPKYGVLINVAKVTVAMRVETSKVSASD